MSYLPPGLADLATAFQAEEEDDVLRVRMGTRTDSSDIALLHRYVSEHESHTDTTFDEGLNLNGFVRHSHHHSSGSSSHHQVPIRRSNARPMPPLNPQTFHGSLGNNSASNTADPVNSSSSSSSRFGVESPYLFRRMSDLSRRLGSSSTDLSGINLNTGCPSGLPGSSGNSGGPPELEESDGEPVRQSTSSESQALYGNENAVTDLKPDYVRWFFKNEKDLKWTPFAGYDSIRMEKRYRNLLVERDELQQYYGTGFSGTQGTNVSNEYSSDAYYSNGTFYPSESTSESQRQQQQYGQYEDWSNSAGGMYNQNQSASSHYVERGAASSPYTGQNYGSSTNYSNVDSQQTETVPDDGVCGNVIIVRGGLYEADLETWTCVATYWPGDKCQITRGTWFYDGTWQPLSVEHAEKLEEDHIGNFLGHTLDVFSNTGTQPDSPTRKRPALHRVSFSEFHVDWTSPTEIHLFSKAASHKFMRSVGLKFGFQAWGYRLCRGYYKPASIADKPSEISHIVFVIHGIGQKMDTGRIVRNCASFRELVSTLKEKFYPHLNETKQRAEFFPVEWRSAAKLDDDIVDAITPHKLMSLRQILNATAMDIMYYTSPLYRGEITNALRNELNRIYSNFVKRNPDFITRGGKVSVIAHSLGAVITYDIVTGYTPDFSRGPEQQIPYGGFGNSYSDGNGYYATQHESNIPPGLLFKLEHFFCFGSPLAVFLALRWKDPQSAEVRPLILPEKLCRRIYNIFCLTDPVAYRLEPLLNKAYMIISPLPIYQHGTVGKPKYDEMPRERIRDPPLSVRTENATVIATSENSSAKTTPQRLANLKSPPTPTKDSNWGWFGIMKYLKSSENPGGSAAMSDVDLVGAELMSPDGNSSPPRDDGGSSTPEYSSSDIPNDLDYRIDYVLKENAFTNSYIAALTSHTNYWTSHDTAYFVLMHLYEGLIDSPPQSQAQ